MPIDGGLLRGGEIQLIKPGEPFEIGAAGRSRTEIKFPVRSGMGENENFAGQFAAMESDGRICGNLPASNSNSASRSVSHCRLSNRIANVPDASDASVTNRLVNCQVS